MKITRDNYEIFFIDHLDGNLSSCQEEELRLFLEQNPELATELDGIRGVTLEPTSVVYVQKEQLKKTQLTQCGIENRFDYLCIAHTEGDITDLEKTEFDGLIAKNPSKKSTLETYQKIKLKPDPSVTFKHKEKLTRAIIVNISHYNLRNIASVAAAVGLLFGIFTLIRTVSVESVTHLAQEKPVVIEAAKEEAPKIETDKKTFTPERATPKRVEPLAKVHISPKEPVQTISAETHQEELRFEIATIQPITIAKLDVKPKVVSEINFIPPISPDAVNVEQIYESSVKVSGQSRTITPFDLLQKGIDWVADRTGANMMLDAEKGSDGTITKIYFESTLFAVSRPVRRE